MLGIRQAEAHLTNKTLYELAGQQPVSNEIRKRQLKFIGHCLRMKPDEPANIYALYESKVKQRNRQGRTPFSYINQLSTHITQDKQLKFSSDDIIKLAMNKVKWNSLFVAPKKPA